MGASGANGFEAAFGDVTTLINDASYVPQPSGTNLSVSAGYFWHKATATIRKSASVTVLAFAGDPVATYYLIIDHGTHVAGTIGAVGGNGKGVAGVCWSVKLISAKFLGRAGGTTANAIKAIDYLTDLKTRHGLNLAATNNSWGGGGFSQGLYDAIERANPISSSSPRPVTGDRMAWATTTTRPHTTLPATTTAAITSSGAKSAFSNYGSTSVDLGAPGSGIYSTLPGKNNSSKYGSYSGTSMATPHVTGAATLYAASHPLESAAQIKAALLGSAVPTASLAGKCVTGGRLDVSPF